MKKLFLILIILLISGCKEDIGTKELEQFIEAQGPYIKVSDLKNHPDKSLAEFYEITNTYLNSKKESINNYYTTSSSIEKGDNKISVAMLHANGFKKLLELNKQKIDITGNMSGLDFVMEIDLKERVVLSAFLMQ